jgi:phosphoglycerate kinase
MDLLDILKILALLMAVLKIAKKIIDNNKSNKIYSVAGGGDTVSLLNSLNAVKDFNFVSTAGGAFSRIS